MRLAISNIAWEVAEDDAVAILLKRLAIDAIDVAPGKYFPKPAEATDEDIARVKSWWMERGIEITGMQALLFGTTGLNVFGQPDVQDAMLEHLAAVCRIGAGLGARRLVFGSPRNRDRAGLSDQEAIEVAVSFFRRLGDIAQFHGVMICLEPNPPCYGSNFMTTNAETALMVEHIAHQSVQMQLDTGAITINCEDLTDICKYKLLIGHVHASEPGLVTLGDGDANHCALGSVLRDWLPDSIVSIEMLPAKTGTNLSAVERAISVAVRHYRNGDEGVNRTC